MFLSDHPASAPSAARLQRVLLPAVLALAIGLAIAVGAGGVWFGARLVADAVEDETRDIARINLVIAEKVARDFQAVDLVVRGLVATVAPLMASGPEGELDRIRTEALFQLLRSRIGGVPQLDAVSIVSASGDVLNFTRFWPIPPVNVADRDYFQAMRDDPSRPFFVSVPVQNRGTGSWTIYLARRVDRPDGSFAGLVLGMVTLSYYEEFFRSLNMHYDGRVGLWRSDSVLLARYPADRRAIGVVDPAVAAQHRRIRAGRDAAVAGVDSTSGPDRRLIAVNAVPGFPLYTTIVVDEARVARDHEPQRIAVMAAGLLISAAILVIVALLQRQRTRQRQLEQEVAMRRSAEGRALASEERFRDFAEAAADYFWETDAALRITFVSDGLTRVTGESPAELIGRPLGALCSPAPDAADRCPLARAAARNAAWMDVAVSRAGADGRSVHLLFSGRPIPGRDGTPVGWRGAARDISDQVAAREAAERAQRERDLAQAASIAKSQFLANMSHELRTPLNAILGFSEMMRGEMLGPLGSTTYRGYAADIHHSADHLLQIVNDLLDMSRIEAGRYAIDPAPVAAAELVSEAVAVVRQLAAGCGVSLATAAIDPALTLVVDRRAIKQVLINLLSNSLKFTPGGGTVTIDLAGPDPQGVVVQVRDTGAGIPEDRMRSLFEIFQGGDARQARDKGGAGLGLWISRNLARLHGGDLAIYSVVGHGTTARLSIPLARVAHGTDPAGDPVARPGAGPRALTA